MAASPSKALPAPLLSLCFTDEDRRRQTARQLFIDGKVQRKAPNGAHGGEDGTYS